jgi:hypothetical protein
VGRRKIERFAQLLDEADGGPRHHLRSPIDDELSSLVGLADDLGDIRVDARPSESFRMETRAFLMATAEREGIGRTAAAPEPDRASTVAKVRTGAKQAVERPGRTRIRARGAILVGLAVGTLALSGMSAASGSAMPGDTLYGIKRSQESAQLALASSDAAKGKLYLEFARTRLGEAQAIRTNPTLLKSTLADMDKETRQGVSLLTSDAIAHKSAAPLSTIDQFVTVQAKDLDLLLTEVTSVDPHAQVAASASVARLAGLRSEDIRKVLSCLRIPVVGSDAFGQTVSASCAQAAQVNTKWPVQPESTAPKTSSNTTADVTAADEPTTGPSQPQGLLGDISHLLGGLLGH